MTEIEDSLEQSVHFRLEKIVIKRVQVNVSGRRGSCHETCPLPN